MSTADARRALVEAELARVDGVMPAPGGGSPKHARMALSPWRFMRGSAQLHYADLASGRMALPASLLHVPLTRIQGDCHFSNFGFFTEEGSHGDTVIFAPNDFDDAAVGHAAFDLLRFCISLHLVVGHCRAIAAGELASDDAPAEIRGVPTEVDAERGVRAFLKAYRATCVKMVRSPGERDRAEDRFPGDHLLHDLHAKAARRAPDGDRFRTHSVLGKAATLDGGRLRFRERPDRFVPLRDDEHQRLATAFRPHVDDEILDAVRRIGAGTGSVDLKRYYLLVGPRGELAPEDLHLAHVVEVKQQREAALIHHFPDLSPVNTLSAAQLTVDCQRQMMRRPDLILDATEWDGVHWLVRSRHHARLGVDPELLLTRKRPQRALKEYAQSAARALSRAHARGDRRSTRFEQAMSLALELEADTLAELAREGARLAVEDHARLLELLGTA